MVTGGTSPRVGYGYRADIESCSLRSPHSRVEMSSSTGVCRHNVLPGCGLTEAERQRQTGSRLTQGEASTARLTLPQSPCAILQQVNESAAHCCGRGMHSKSADKPLEMSATKDDTMQHTSV